MPTPSEKRAAERLAAVSPKVTPKMVSYIDGLLIVCGFSARAQRNAWLSSETERDIRYIDSLTLDEGHAIIEALIARRDGTQKVRDDDEDSGIDGDARWNRR